MIAEQTHLLRMDIDPDPEKLVPKNQLLIILNKQFQKATQSLFPTTERVY